MKKHSKRYSISKKLEYEQALRKSKRYLDYEKIKAYENQILSRNLSKLVQSSDSPDFSSAQIMADTSTAARIRYKNTLSTSTKGMLDLGIKHTVSDMLYALPRVRRAFDSTPASYTSFGQAQGSMSDFVLSSEDKYSDSIAEFNKFEDLSKKEQDAIRRAEEELYRISYSLEELEDKGLLTAQEGKQYRTERMSYEERYRFLYLLRNVDNFMQKAEASKFTFIADTYIQRRQGVLVEDFGGKYDKYIREKIREFLQAESRYMSSIERRGELTDDLRRNIETKLKEFDRKVNKSSKSYTNSSKARAEYENRAEMIIATEVSTAYNFGKLIGFSGMQDLEKKFIWNADWELQFTSQYYEVCEHCKSMDGREFTVRELLVIGTQLDVGAGGFGKSGRRTDFKNPSLPMIPSHPHCNCYWTLEQDDRRFESEDIYEDIPIEEINNIDPQRQIIPSTKGNLAMQLAGAGLVVGGAFLLSRSNMWNTFAAALANRNPLPFKQIGDVMDDTLQYVADEFSDDIGVAVSNTVRDIANSPAQLPITKVRAVSLV